MHLLYILKCLGGELGVVFEVHQYISKAPARPRLIKLQLTQQFCFHTHHKRIPCTQSLWSLWALLCYARFTTATSASTYSQRCW